MQPPDGDHQRPAVLDAQLRTDLVPGAFRRGQRRRERGRDADVGGAEPSGVLGEVAGDGQHEVGTAHGPSLGLLQQPLLGAPAVLQGVVQGQHQGLRAAAAQSASHGGDQTGPQAVGVHEVGVGGGRAQLRDRSPVRQGRHAGRDADRREHGARPR